MIAKMALAVVDNPLQIDRPNQCSQKVVILNDTLSLMSLCQVTVSAAGDYSIRSRDSAPLCPVDNIPTGGLPQVLFVL